MVQRMKTYTCIYFLLCAPPLIAAHKYASFIFWPLGLCPVSPRVIIFMTVNFRDSMTILIYIMHDWTLYHIHERWYCKIIKFQEDKVICCQIPWKQGTSVCTFWN